jgi:hypothetical protein
VKNINHEHKNETAHIAELLLKLKADSPDLAEKVSELQRADKYVSCVLHLRGIAHFQFSAKHLKQNLE